MFDPLDFENRRLKERLDRKRALSFFVLSAERLLLATWRLILCILLFAALWMLEIPAHLGHAGEISSFFLFIAGVGFFGWRDVRHFRFPSRYDADRRLEKDSGLLHRPVSGLEDTLSNGTKPQTRGLWIESKLLMLEVVRHIKSPAFRTTLAEKDPYALRLGILLLFFIALIVAGPQASKRIEHGLTPFTMAKAQNTGERISLWITPPTYTHAKQIILGSNHPAPHDLKIPEGSTLKLRVNGGFGRPRLVSDQGAIRFKSLGGHNYSYEGIVPRGSHLKVSQFFIPRAAWNYTLLPDDPPALAAKGPPQLLDDGQISVPMTVYDDYGVRDITMHMHLDPSVTNAPAGEPVAETRSVMSPAATPYDINPIYDLSWHVWAGLPVVLDFAVTDEKGQIGPMAPIHLTLPERVFRHPVAKQIIDLRKKLILDAQNNALPASLSLQDLLNRPGDFQNDLVVFLSLRSASSRLYYNPPQEVVKDVVSLLWDTALRIEDGNVSLAANNLREAQRNLENTLKKPDATPEEIAQAMAKLKQAMAQYLTEMQKELQKRMANGEDMPMIPPGMMGAMMDPQALGKFLEEMEAKMRAGDKGAAQEMLSQLQRMMDSLGSSMSQKMPEDMKFMSEGINELQQLIERQQQLLDQTAIQAGILTHLQAQDYGETLPAITDLMKQWNLEGMPPAPEMKKEVPQMSVNTQKGKTEQEDLRHKLGEIMLQADEKLGKIPDNMSAAELEMRKSTEALGDNKPSLSVPRQQKTIEYLKQSMQELSQQMAARMQQMGGFSFGAMRFDPLGRPMPDEGKDQGRSPGSTVKIPDGSQRKRVEEILDLLRQRSGELERPQPELEYYRRLLRQF